jgi:DNA-binding CsgD family transcriptional regulator
VNYAAGFGTGVRRGFEQSRISLKWEWNLPTCLWKERKEWIMSIAISSALSAVTVGANSPTTVAAAQPAQQVQQTVQEEVQQPATSSGDTVTLTEAQQVYNLYNEGQTVSQISTNLSLPVSMVNNYLGITSGG